MFLLLRPEHKCLASQQALQQAGLTVYALPLQRIKEDKEQLQQLPEKLNNLADTSKVIFVSPVAAELATQQLAHGQWPQNLSYFAVGSTTAAVLEQLDLTVTTPDDQRTEGLLALSALQQVQQQSILLVKGKNGRQTLQQQLTQRGAHVESIELYQRQSIKLQPPEMPWQQQGIRCIICTSNEQVELAFEQLPRDWLQQLHWIVVSPRAEQKLKDYGVKFIHQSLGASDQALTDAAHILTEQFMSENSVKGPKQEQQQTPGSKGDNTTQAHKSKRPGGTFGLLLAWFNFIALLALAAGGYWFWQQWQTQQQTQVSQEQIQQLQQAQSQQQSQLTSALEQQQQKIAQELQPLLESNKVQQQKLQQLASRRPNDWLLAEADYLVKMAGRKIWLEKDLATSVQLLEAADQRLQNMADPSLLPTRQLIRQDIQRLKQVNPIDKQQLALVLLALVEQSRNLPLAMITLPDAELAEQNQPLSQSTNDWQQNLKKTWQQFADGFITVKRRTEMVKPLMSAQQQWYSRQQLQHYLLQAQQALINNQALLYTQALQQANSQLELDFDLSTSAVKAVKQEIQQLAQQNIKGEYPSQLQAQQAIQDLLQSRAEHVFNPQGSQL